MGFVGFGSLMPIIHVFMFASHFLVVYLLCCAFHAHSKMSHRHLLVFLRASWITMCLALPAHASHMHTTCTSFAHAYIHAMFLHFNQASYTYLHICFI